MTAALVWLPIGARKIEAQLRRPSKLQTFEAQGRLALFGFFFFAKGNQGDFQSEEKSQGWFVQTRRLDLGACDSRCGVEDATGGEEAANGLERRERETSGGHDANRRSFSGEVAGVIRNHKDGEARRRRIELGIGLGNYPVWARAWVKF
ncbi:hypothetical protein U1Q18_031427 [Sarracenia purpurea var. burkii]